ncbi:cryptochrome/photolyase family protein [Aestuariispira ectoiniformans]|uniref:cryptochrome/photolyase family protein n=1 Tax=Aestuariispira ectoiniformans TaxID=2775080 RepID=UPI00223AFAD0|nr:deoxyribodipyrimidine photo-lyase [Aestuariispira ectoiniformans]
MTTIVWFRQDLRLADNPALLQAAARGEILPVFILDEETQPLGGASRWWLHHSLEALSDSLGGLCLFKGNPGEILPGLVTEVGADAIYWNRLYEPAAISRDKALKSALGNLDIEVHSFNAALLHEPWEVQTKTGGPYKVYTPYWRAAQVLEMPYPTSKPQSLEVMSFDGGDALSDWALLPSDPDWAAGWRDLWQPGEAGACARLEQFLEKGLQGYGQLRDRPDLPNVSRLSPHLHFGEISPRLLFARLDFVLDQGAAPPKDVEKFKAELGWREFAYHLLYHFPDLPGQNWRREFDNYPWADDDRALRAWQRGQTGYPIVDAGMRELWQTGYMHNRVRMITASFLIKHLRLHWKHGMDWFADTLLDADLANNAAGWQWVAGSGADAAPYFRIFNPMTQGEKFDPDGTYIRRWCPELADLPTDHIYAPFDAPLSVLTQAGIVLGETYPRPIVDHAQARAAALAGYDAVKAGGPSSN